MAHFQDSLLFITALYYSNFCFVLLVHHLHAPQCDSIGSLPNGSLHILVPSFWVYVSLSFRRCNNVSDGFIQYLVFSFACFLAHFAFLIDFVRRNDDFTFIYSSRARPFPPFYMAGAGGLIRQGGTNSPSATLPFLARGNFYGMTALRNCSSLLRLPSFAVSSTQNLLRLVPYPSFWGWPCWLCDVCA